MKQRNNTARVCRLVVIKIDLSHYVVLRMTKHKLGALCVQYDTW